MSHLVESWIRQAPGVDQVARFFAEASDPWEYLHLGCAPLAFGAGSHRAFAEYFQGTSRVLVRSLSEICAWLAGCECLPDHALFFQDDFWQHPLTFEQIRKGDCEDHALWAWRKLAEIGIPARFAAGRWRGIAHAWVVLEDGAGPRLLETTAKAEPLIRDLAGPVRTEYCPALSVDHTFRTFVHAGYPIFARSRC